MFNGKSYTSDFWDRFQARDMERKKHTVNSATKVGKQLHKTPASKIVLSAVGNGKMGAPRGLLITTTYAR